MIFSSNLRGPRHVNLCRVYTCGKVCRVKAHTRWCDYGNVLYCSWGVFHIKNIKIIFLYFLKFILNIFILKKFKYIKNIKYKKYLKNLNILYLYLWIMMLLSWVKIQQSLSSSTSMPIPCIQVFFLKYLLIKNILDMFYKVFGVFFVKILLKIIFFI